MQIKLNQQLFENFRHKYTTFNYEKYDLKIKNNSILCEFDFNIDNKYFFKPTFEIPERSFFNIKSIPDQLLNNIVFNIGMIELISYWKATCSPKIIVKPFKLNNEQINFWKKIYFNGLGEFFYLNSITTNIDDFVDIMSDSKNETQKTDILTENAIIVPIGGGKDSVVSLELLKKLPYRITPLIMNPRKATTDTVNIAGFGIEKTIIINRSIHPELLKLNELGFLNGHTPFSALLAFYTLLASALNNSNHIALSNESSANETTVENSNVNHQYSKSFEFEKDFREYTEKYISGSFNYFSFLRPLSEIQIGKIFSRFTKYHLAFRSCNVGSKNDTWCGKCPKCLFAFIILSPYIERNKMIEIFGSDLLNDEDLLFYFEQLIGIEKVKPFECIGTVSEVNIAVNLIIKKIGENELPYLLKYYKSANLYEKYSNLDFKTEINNIENNHFLTDEFIKLIKDELY